MMQAEVVSGVWRRVRGSTVAPWIARAIRLLVDHHARCEYLVIELSGSAAATYSHQQGRAHNRHNDDGDADTRADAGQRRHGCPAACAT
jgi:hypothetical protein